MVDQLNEKPAVHHRLFTKFLYILVPVFLLFAIPGLGWFVHTQLDTSREHFAARIGNMAARTAGSISRHKATANPSLTHDFLAALSADGSITCAEVTKVDGTIVAQHPPQLGCDFITPGEAMVLPLRDGGALSFRFSDSELVNARQMEVTIIGTIILFSFIFAVVAASVGFHFIVQRPLRLLLEMTQPTGKTITARPTRRHTRDELGIVAKALDGLITRENDRKAELHTLNQELEQRVLRRTHELERALAAAETANDAKNMFLGQMSHELRTPLNAVIGFSELMCEHVHGPLGNSEYDTYARNINVSGQHLLTIIANMLDYVQSECSEGNGYDELVDAAVLMEESIGQAAKANDVGKITLIQDTKVEAVKILGEPEKLQRMLSNLIENAIKFTPPGGEIRISCRTDDNNQVVFGISDTGIGMNSDDIAAALEVFGQIDSSLGRTFDGAGLGLTVSERIVRQHRGFLTIDSEPGVGTTVYVTLPATMDTIKLDTSTSTHPQRHFTETP